MYDFNYKNCGKCKLIYSDVKWLFGFLFIFELKNKNFSIYYYNKKLV